MQSYREYIGSLANYVFFVLLSCAGMTVEAKDNKTIQVGYVNIRKIMAKAPQLKQIQENLAFEFDADRQRIINLRIEIAELTNFYDESAAKSGNMSAEAIETLQKKIDNKQLALNNLQQRMQNEFNLRRNESLAKLQTLVVQSVAKVSKEKRLDIVLNNTGVIYVNQRVDITPDVFKYLAKQKVD